MDVLDVKAGIVKIEEAGNDYEMAHALEDELYLKLLRAIADGTCTNPKECAAEALTTQYMDFPRYCA